MKLLLKTIEQLIDVIVTAFRNGKVYFCGNGGSAADAQHLAAEFSGRFYTDQKSIACRSLHCNTSYLTAVANDYSYDVIYSRMIDGIGQKGDVLDRSYPLPAIQQILSRHLKRQKKKE